MSDRVVFDDEFLEAVRRARPEFDDLPDRQAVLERVLGEPGRTGRPRRRASWVRGVPLALAISATVVVAAAAVLTLGGHARPGGAGLGGHGARGKILDRDGRVLAGGVIAGVETTYGGDLSHGATLRTTVDPGLERVGDAALQHAISANQPASGGGFVALDPNNGEVYAMGSLPSSSPLNRATQLAGPVGSAFAPITALAALRSGAWSAGATYDDTGQYCFDGQCRHNGGQAVDGVLDVQSALKVGSNDFFYNLGALTNPGGAVQRLAETLGFGQRTGIDLPDESAGMLPTPAWLAHVDHRPWSAGDNESLAVGQGDVEITPLQLAVAYAAIENGGKVVRPHIGLGLTFERGDRTVGQSIVRAPAGRLNLDGPGLAAVRAGLRDASSEPGGTSADVFGRFPVAVYGETGSAQHAGQQDYAWYAGFVPGAHGVPPLVVVVTVEEGGYGDVAAAPVARQIFSQWLFGRPGPWVAGTAQTL